MSEENAKKISMTVHQRDSKCETHGRYTERGMQFMVGYPIRWNGCGECIADESAREESEAKRKDEDARQAKIESALKIAGIPMAFRNRNFENYCVDRPEQQHALDVARDFADNFWIRHRPAGACLVFAGEMGTGKSHLAISIAQQVMRRGTAMYLRAADMIRRVRSTWSRESVQSEDEVLRMFERLDLLVIDEVGVQRGTEDEQRILFDVIDRRYSELRPTILLTNLNGASFAEFIGPRLMDRLRERAVVVPFKWASHRGRQQ